MLIELNCRHKFCLRFAAKKAWLDNGFQSSLPKLFLRGFKKTEALLGEEQNVTAQLLLSGLGARVGV